MSEQRRAVRYQISYYLRILNKNTDEAIGHIVDMSLTGMRILADRPIAKDTEYSLSIDLKSVTNFEPEVILKAKCVWVSEDPESGAFNCGFQLIDVTDKEQNLIDRLISQFGEER